MRILSDAELDEVFGATTGTITQLGTINVTAAMVSNWGGNPMGGGGWVGTGGESGGSSSSCVWANPNAPIKPGMMPSIQDITNQVNTYGDLKVPAGVNIYFVGKYCFTDGKGNYSYTDNPAWAPAGYTTRIEAMTVQSANTIYLYASSLMEGDVNHSVSPPDQPNVVTQNVGHFNAREMAISALEHELYHYYGHPGTGPNYANEYVADYYGDRAAKAAKDHGI